MLRFLYIILGLQIYNVAKNRHLLSDFALKFQSPMTIFHLQKCQDAKKSKLCFIDWSEISLIMPQKSGRAKACMQPHINSHADCVGFWTMDELKVRWVHDNTWNLIHKQCQQISYHNDVKYPMTLNSVPSKEMAFNF